MPEAPCDIDGAASSTAITSTAHPAMHKDRQSINERASSALEQARNKPRNRSCELASWSQLVYANQAAMFQSFVHCQPPSACHESTQTELERERESQLTDAGAPQCDSVSARRVLFMLASFAFAILCVLHPRKLCLIDKKILREHDRPMRRKLLRAILGVTETPRLFSRHHCCSRNGYQPSRNRL